MKKTNEVKAEEFIGEFATVDLSRFKDKTFAVMVSTGDRDSCKALTSTLHGPYGFSEMVEEVATMWKREQHHAKVFILSKEQKDDVFFLDQNTVDYIEAKWDDILIEGMLEGFDKEFDYEATALTEKEEIKK